MGSASRSRKAARRANSLDRARRFDDARQAEMRELAGVGALVNDERKSLLLQVFRVEMASVVGIDFNIHHQQELLAGEDALQLFRAQNMPDDLAGIVADRRAAFSRCRAIHRPALPVTMLARRRRTAVESGAGPCFADVILS